MVLATKISKVNSIAFNSLPDSHGTGSSDTITLCFLSIPYRILTAVYRVAKQLQLDDFQFPTGFSLLLEKRLK